jgi:hypothetical protein
MDVSNRRLAAVIFICAKCGQPYRAIQERFSYERPGRFDCVKCSAPVHSWRGFFDFAEWTPEAMEGPKTPTGIDPNANSSAPTCVNFT